MFRRLLVKKFFISWCVGFSVMQFVPENRDNEVTITCDAQIKNAK